ncbi:MAG: recombinase RarA, partial [Treponema sp.]|nr:recombinase RarA [Treponema sp.]
ASRDAESFGHGEGYVYPHAYRDHWAAQQYLPSALAGRTFYIPSESGYESKIRDEVLRKRELQAAIVLGDGRADAESLTWSASAKGREGWLKRLESGRSKLLLGDRDALFKRASPSRHDRVLIPLANDGLLLWECLRRCPEGLCAALVDSDAARDALLRYASALDQTELPEIAVFDTDHRGTALLPNPEQASQWFSTPQFDHILVREPWRRAFRHAADGEHGIVKSAQDIFTAFAANVKPLLADRGKLCLLCSAPSMGERISRILREYCGADMGLVNTLAENEENFFSENKPGGKNPQLWNWDETALARAFKSQGFTVQTEIISQDEERRIQNKELDAWFDIKNSRWGSYISSVLAQKDFLLIKDLLANRIQQGPLTWKWKSIILQGTKSI